MQQLLLPASEIYGNFFFLHIWVYFESKKVLQDELLLYDWGYVFVNCLCTWNNAVLFCSSAYCLVMSLLRECQTGRFSSIVLTVVDRGMDTWTVRNCIVTFVTRKASELLNHVNHPWAWTLTLRGYAQINMPFIVLFLCKLGIYWCER